MQFITADKKMAGTKGTVHLSLLGEKECSKVFHFTNNHGQRFQRGQTDTFQVAVNETKIGPVAAVKVAHSSLLMTESKHCVINSILCNIILIFYTCKIAETLCFSVNFSLCLCDIIIMYASFNLGLFH